MRCIVCESQAETRCPYPLCQTHATEYYTGLLMVVAGRRIARNPPEVAKKKAELDNILALRNSLASRKGETKRRRASKWAWTRVKLD